MHTVGSCKKKNRHGIETSTGDKKMGVTKTCENSTTGVRKIDTTVSATGHNTAARTNTSTPVGTGTEID